MEQSELDEVRAQLEDAHGEVWDTREAQEHFEFLGFALGIAVVRRKSDGVRGMLDFQHMPRFYFNFSVE